MDNFLGGWEPPRKELQGPRPTPLKVRKDSYKVKKPPVGPQPLPHHQPVIIYTVSPKVIHASPSDFMMLVQRLTGSDDSTSSSSSFQSSSMMVSGAISPAARLASIEKTKLPLEGKKKLLAGPSEEEVIIEVSGGLEGVERTGFCPGILSPGPGSFPPISPNFFSPFFSDPSNVNMLHDFSAVQHGSRSYMPSPFPTNFTSPNSLFSPSSLDLLHHILDS